MNPVSRTFAAGVEPEPLRTDGSNAFARHSMAVRVPGIIQEVLDRNRDYSPAVRQALTDLHDRVAGDEPMQLFPPPAPDYDLWRRWFVPFEGQTWLNTEWFFAEMLVYRLIVEAGNYWSTLRDPFAPVKRDEMEALELWQALERLLQPVGSTEEQLIRLMTSSLWGNRIDLSLKQTAAMGMHAADEHLIANDIPAAVAHLLEREPGDVHVIMDNAGTEQAMDLALVDALLSTKVARRVILHVKMHPVLVSDATIHDVHALLAAMNARGGQAAALAARTNGHVASKSLLIVSDFFWTTPGLLRDLPSRLDAAFRGAVLVVGKGDINYRRITNDAVWPAGSTLSQALGGFPAPLIALRTLKSDTLIGLNEAQWDHLNKTAPSDWRTSGAYAVAQSNL